MEQLDEIVQEFLVESYEGLDQLDNDLLALEEVPNDFDRLSSIFRAIHTIKGTSGFLAFPKLEKVTHVGESLLVPLRDGKLKLTHPIANGLLAMVDAVREILSEIESSGGEGETDYQSLLAQLENLRAGEAAAEPQATTGSASKSKESSEPEPTSKATECCEVESSTEPVVEANLTTSKSPQPAAPPLPKPSSTQEPRAPTTDGERNTSVSDTTVRIDVRLLDRLMNLVGELVLARNQILQFGRESDEASILAASQRLNLITTELQEGVMKTRMQPIRNAWNMLPRVVRDLSNACGKSVDVRTVGEDTELDKTILEAIKDPLTHIVRNSVDHGIESPEVRQQNGKPKTGTLLLRAFHEGGQVNIEISDDGSGIDLERVKDKAICKGLITPEYAETMTDRELTNLVLMPGFSTAPKVTNVSGRGVGMDVVKTNVERIGGTLDIHSVPGRGTTLRIKIPLTLAIVPALLVTSAGDRYAIPQASLLELVRLEADRAKIEIEVLHDVPVYRLRGDLLPLIYLNKELNIESNRGDECAVNIVVLQAEERTFGLVVDEINDTQEIVVKPLCPHVNSVAAYAGATIMGDGTVALILDILGLAQQSNVVTERRDDAISLRDNARSKERIKDRDSLLLVDPGDGSRVAIPLHNVARLEEFGTDEIESINHRPVVQYRGKVMRLVSIDGGDGFAAGSTTRLPVVVYHKDGRDVGVLVGSILDIVTEDDFDESGGDHIIKGRVTRVVDLSQTLEHVLPFDETSAA